MERFCISLGQAKRLKELGFEKISNYKWLLRDERWMLELSYLSDVGEECLSAYHVGELGELLPDHITTEEGVYYLNTVKYNGAGCAMVYQSDDNSYLVRADEDTEAQARGALLIYLLENNLL